MIMKKYVHKILLTLAFIVPHFAFAQRTLKTTAASFLGVVGRSLLPMLFSIALAWFIWGIVDFIRGADNPETRSKGKSRMIWGILGLLAIVAYISLTGVFTETFFGDAPSLPLLKTN
jgi:hypothetical protein